MSGVDNTYGSQKGQKYQGEFAHRRHRKRKSIDFNPLATGRRYWRPFHSRTSPSKATLIGRFFFIRQKDRLC
jgi:hypothetical protein